jgi:hypothetical protein
MIAQNNNNNCISKKEEEKSEHKNKDFAFNHTSPTTPALPFLKQTRFNGAS